MSDDTPLANHGHEDDTAENAAESSSNKPSDSGVDIDVGEQKLRRAIAEGDVPFREIMSAMTLSVGPPKPPDLTPDQISKAIQNREEQDKRRFDFGKWILGTLVVVVLIVCATLFGVIWLVSSDAESMRLLVAGLSGLVAGGLGGTGIGASLAKKRILPSTRD
ncbi:MAG: hypothetical protein AAF916_10900 [Planctomycetota bacterium]